MPVYHITAPDGKKFRIEVPEGVTEAEVLQHVQENYQPDPAALEAQKKADFGAKVAAQNLISQEEYDPAAGENPLVNFAAGNTRGLKSFVGGARQLYNKVTGDEEELLRLNQEAAARNKQDEPLLATTAGAAGDVVGKVAPAVLASALASRFAPAIPAVAGAAGLGGTMLRGGLSLLGGATGGGLGGAMSELTPSQEAEGGRLEATKIGAELGALLPAGVGIVKWGGRQVADAFRELPEEALRRMAAGLGYADAPSASIQQLQDAIQSRLGAARTQASSMYRAAEGGPELPPVSLSPANAALSRESADTLFNPLEQQLNPKLSRVTAALRQSTAPTEQTLLRGSADTTPAILGQSGAPIRAGEIIAQPATTSFADMREAIRELKKAGRADPKNAQGYRNLVDHLESSLDNWSSMDPASSEALAAGRAADEFYRQNVLPLVRKRTPIGAMLNDAEELVPGAGERMLQPERSLELDKLLGHVPEARAPLRAMAGRQILRKTGSTPAADQLRNLPPQLLTAEERDLQGRIIDALRRRTGTGQSWLPNIFQGTGALARWKNGVEPAFSPAGRRVGRTLSPIMSYNAGRADEESY